MESFARRHFLGLEVARLDCGGHYFAPHFHDEFVLSVNVRGHERIKLERKSLEAGEGEITLYNPAQIQSSQAVSGEWEFFSLYVDPIFLADAFDLSPETVFDRPILTHGGAALRMKAAIAYALDTDVSEAEALERLVQTLDDLLTLAGSRRATVSRHIPLTLRRVANCLTDLAPMPTLAELSAEVDLTPVQLVRAFTRAYGLPPFAWALNRRLNEARVRVLKGDKIANIAADLGFADQAHLTRRFRAQYGVPPGRWRKG
jgi:AraC family chemosensory pili system transcriptional regulator ChpD